MASLFEDIIGETPKDVNKFVGKAMDIADQIVALLKAKGLTQRQLSQLLGKRESEISKWLSGTHNFTLETISKIEAVLDDDIIIAPMYLNEYTGMFRPAKTTFYVESNPNNSDLRNYQFLASNLEKPSLGLGVAKRINFDDFTDKNLNSFKGKTISGHYSHKIEDEAQTDSLKLVAGI